MIKNFTSVFRFFVSGIVLLSLFFSGSADLSAQNLSSQDIKLTYERDASNSITEKDQKYFVKL